MLCEQGSIRCPSTSPYHSFGSDCSAASAMDFSSRASVCLFTATLYGIVWLCGPVLLSSGCSMRKQLGIFVHRLLAIQQ